MYIKRTLLHSITNYKDKFPIIALTGPRQSGKTTLLKEAFSDYTYINLENPDVREFAENDPNGFLNMYDRYVILDEVQRVPKLFSYIQAKVDESKIMGQYIFSGSQNFQLMQNITQSLAGRVILFKLLPFDFTELAPHNLLKEEYTECLIQGFYPAIFDRKIPSKVFYNNYIQTYIERDVTELINIHDIRLFRNFLSLCATRAGQMLNINTLANECGISQPTAKAWLSVLESSYLIFLLHPYHKNFSKRVIKSPKLYFYDTGLLAHLLKIQDPIKLAQDSTKGALFENLIIAEKMKCNHHQYLMQDFWFWRDSNGKEVDLIVQDEQINEVFEIKSTATITQKLFSGLDYYASISTDKITAKKLVYSGENNQERSDYSICSWRMME